MKNVKNEFRINAALGVLADLRAAIQSDQDCYLNSNDYQYVGDLENYLTLIDGIEFYLTH